MRQLPHARGRRHAGPDRPQPRLRVPRSRAVTVSARARSSRSSAARSPTRSRTRRPALPACPQTSSRARTPTTSRATSPRSPGTGEQAAPAQTSTDAAGDDRACHDDRRQRGGCGRRGSRQDGLHLGRVRRLPHPRRRGRDRHRRPEPRRGEALADLVVERVTNGKGRDAAVQGPAQRDADRGRRRVRLQRRRQVASRTSVRRPAPTTCVTGHVEARADRLDDALLEPVRAALLERRDHDLVGGEAAAAHPRARRSGSRVRRSHHAAFTPAARERLDSEAERAPRHRRSRRRTDPLDAPGTRSARPRRRRRPGADRLAQARPERASRSRRR